MGRRPNDYWGKLGEPTRGHDYWGKLKTDEKMKGMAGWGCRFVLEVVHRGPTMHRHMGPTLKSPECSLHFTARSPRPVFCHRTGPAGSDQEFPFKVMW